jgi:ubiquinol-cytochrome c reductase cytochrome b subunit
LTGYLLPWDQKAYWATTVTVNIAKSGPLGQWVSGLMQGGTTLGSLTLLRWYATHVFLLPGALIAFVIAHLYLMRRHGISGALKHVEGPSKPFYPYHAFKDTIAGAVVFSALLTLAYVAQPPLDALADPTDASYVPRPEWYFLSLFQLLKYFPGPLEPLATTVIPGAIVLLLLALPFLDSRPDRHPFKRPLVTGGFAIIGMGIIVLTYLGYKDTPAHSDPARWTPMAIAGREFTRDTRCLKCHTQGGVANPIENTRVTRDPEWLVSHVRDPEVITAGLRPVPRGAMTEAQARSILSYMKKVRSGATTPPPMDDTVRTASLVFGRYCSACHMIDFEGGAAGPDLTHAGAKRDAKWLKDWIAEPEAIDPAANMPPFIDRLSDEQLTAIANYLAARK